MFNLILGLVIGLVIGWNLPQPKWAKLVQQYVVDYWKSQ